MLFLPNQQELDCISDSGCILGQITFDIFKDEYQFRPDSESIEMSEIDKLSIVEKLAGLKSGKYSMPMLDED